MSSSARTVGACPYDVSVRIPHNEMKKYTKSHDRVTAHFATMMTVKAPRRPRILSVTGILLAAAAATVNGLTTTTTTTNHHRPSLNPPASAASDTTGTLTTTIGRRIHHDNDDDYDKKSCNPIHDRKISSRLAIASSSKTFLTHSAVLRSLWLSMIIVGGVCTSNSFVSSLDKSAAAAEATTSSSILVHAESTPTPTLTTKTIILSGTVINPTTTSPSSTPDTASAAALYVTARPNTPDNVPAAILSGTRGKPPPVLAARFSQQPTLTFPFKFDLVVPDNLTPEGAAAAAAGDVVDASAATTVVPEDTVIDPKKLWWSTDDLIVSVRLDQDGVASTRSPDDLVGRGLWAKDGNSKISKHIENNNDNNDGDRLEIRLEGRGAFGKLVTGGSK